MGFLKKLPIWNARGAEPPNSKKNVGWQPDERPTAENMNWFQNTTYEAVDELQKNAVHKDDFNQKTNELTTQLADTVPVNFGVLGGVRSIFATKLNEIYEILDSTKFNIGFITDAHYENKIGFYPFAKYSITHTQNLASLSDKLQAIICGGDNVHSEELAYQTLIKRAQDFADSVFDNSNCDSFILLGNHDDGSNMTTDPNKIIQNSDFTRINKYSSSVYAESRNNSSPYFYKDYPLQKIRLIGLNSVDIPILSDSNGLLKYKRISHYGFSDEQLNWLANEALGTVPDGYHVAIFSHHPIMGRTQEGEYYHNFEPAVGLIEAFMAGGTYTYTSSETDFLCSVNKTFSKPNTVIGCFHGHNHYDSLVTRPSGLKVIGCRNSVTDNEADYNTILEDSFDVITVDTTIRKVNLNRFGRGTSREFTY